MSTSADADLVVNLVAATKGFNVIEVERICATFVAGLRDREDPVDPITAVQVLKILQSKRHMSLVQDVAEALLAHGTDNWRVRHRYALALLDHDRTVAAASLLQTLPAEERSHPEVAGALGRVHKQRYLTSGPSSGTRESDLRQAVEAYGTTYLANPEQNYFHGINTATLLNRAHRDGVEIRDHPDPLAEARGIAETILAHIRASPEPALWELATAAEACLVLGRYDDALSWTAYYVGDDTADAFEFASTMRQFEQLWQLTSDSEPGMRLLPLLRNRLLQAEGGVISVAPSEFTPESLSRFDHLQHSLEKSGGTRYEAVFGWDRFKSPKWLREALDTCRSVALVEDKYDEGWGSGFVLDGRRIRSDWPARVLLTNAHVVPDALGPADAWIAFRGLSSTGPEAATRVKPVGEPLFHSPKWRGLDACVLALPDDLSDEVVGLNVREQFPTLGAGSHPRAYVIGYPKGSPSIQVSLHDTLLLAGDEPYAHYRSPTEKGSSGSPVFDDTWQVIALHHGAVDNVANSAEPANEGIRMDTLMRAFKHADPGSPG